jgi:serine/threonine-protein kinase HipA
MARSGNIFMHNTFAGTINETDEGGFEFAYDEKYLKDAKNPPVSLTLPLQEQAFQSKVLFSFFDGLIPEGWLLELTVKNWKLDYRDRMGLLLEACGDCIGAVRVEKND